MPSFTYTALATVFTALVAVSAAPVSIEQRGKPSGWATGYLEDYDVYHTRYLALSCQTQHNTTFFSDCCRPLLATENLVDNRKEYCTPTASATVSAVAAIATGTNSTAADVDSEAEYCDESTSVAAMVSSSVEALQATATESVTAITITSEHSVATLAVQNQLASAAEPTTTSAPAWVAPVTSEAPQAPATTAAASSGGDVKTGGFATYYYQNGNPGACGDYHSDSDMIVAIGGDYYGWSGAKSSSCGRWVTITNSNNGKTVSAMIADLCPTCVTGNSIDMSSGAFQSIASEADGMVPITWTFNN